MEFEAHRAVLFGIAYRMLGEVAAAEDVVQEAWLRWRDADATKIESPRAWLATVVTRLCLDQLKSARARREEYVGPWLPEPLDTATARAPLDAEGLESLSLAFLVLLESLSPLERAVYLLAEVFDYSHAEVAAIVGRDEAACRQLLHRAREHVRERRPRFAPSREAHQALLGRFVQAITVGDVDGVKALLAADARLVSDGGGKALAARKPLHGADAVARFLLGVSRKSATGISVEPRDLNGAPALLVRQDGKPALAVTLETDGQTIYGLCLVANPDKLSRL